MECRSTNRASNECSHTCDSQDTDILMSYTYVMSLILAQYNVKQALREASGTRAVGKKIDVITFHFRKYPG
jgi:hypothetical protein